MTLIVAVSGGVDSVVLLDMLVTGHVLVEDNDVLRRPCLVVVAHFDHGIREDSAADARFVEGVAQRYGLTYVSTREELGSGASEESARARRYEFLREVAATYKGQIVTAHHLDDLVETIVLNIQRGTRWRGLAAMNNAHIVRPLLKRTKSELIAYALGRRLEWVEDETNNRDTYQRNRIRTLTTPLPLQVKQQLYTLWQAQHDMRQKIGEEIGKRHFPITSRHFLMMIEPDVGRELLYEWVLQNCGVSLLSSQLDYALHGIKLGRPGARLEIGQGIEVCLTKRTWSVQTRSEMLK